jgi:hypothetical protein
MKWQMADWFFVAIFLLFVGMHFVGRGRHGAHRGDGGTDGRPSPPEGKEYERHGPKLNM